MYVRDDGSTVSAPLTPSPRIQTIYRPDTELEQTEVRKRSEGGPIFRLVEWSLEKITTWRHIHLHLSKCEVNLVTAIITLQQLQFFTSVGSKNVSTLTRAPHSHSTPFSVSYGFLLPVLLWGWEVTPELGLESLLR